MSQHLLGTMRADTCHSSAPAADEANDLSFIRLENITKTYHLGDINVPVLKGVSLTIARGEMVALMGASGSGKTTLMNILGCLDRPSSGQFWLDGEEMSQLTPDERAVVRTSKLGFVFQSFNLLPRTTAQENVVMPLDYALRRPSHHESRRRAASLLEQVGLADRADHEPSQMSGGQQQRAAIARSLVNRPALLLADEPTGNLDSRTGDEILRMFQRLNAQGITIILVTHDAKVAGYAHRTIRIADGLIEEPPHRPSRERRRSGDGRHPDVTDRAIRALHHHVPAFARRPYGNGAALAGLASKSGAAEVDSTTDSVAHINGANSEAQPAADGSSQPATPSQIQPKPESQQAQSRPSRHGHMLPPVLRTALGNLHRNKLRSALTALGVIIGVGAVIAMTEIGEGSKSAIDKTIASMGAYKIPVFPSAAKNAGVSQGAGTVQTLKPADVDEILRQCPAVSEVVPMVWAHSQVVYGKKNWFPQGITGTSPRYLAIRDWEDLDEGQCFTEDDVRKGAAVCLIGATVRRELFDDESPIGKMIRIRNVPFRVVGLLDPRGANMQGQDQDDVIIAPWTTIKFRVNSQGAGSANGSVAAATTSTSSSTTSVNSISNPYPPPTPLYPQPSIVQQADTPQPVRQTNVDFIMAKAAGADQVADAMEQISSVLRDRHHLMPGDDDDFKVLDVTEMSRAAARTSELMSTLLMAVAAISLVVGGVGIMNIMLVSVTERTREIGLRMAVGARRHHILQQFLVEAVVLCLVGGAFGILAGRGVSILIRELEHWTTAVSWPAICISVFVAAGVGIVFGFYPAWKASRLDPIEALRHE
jgi:ABC-type lipoprotein export system ATPase subunit/ABC-type antimicrobial peptide transport system permease subunit